MAAGVPRTDDVSVCTSGTALLVEDNDLVRSLVRCVLEQEGYEVLVTGSGVDALLLAETHPEPIDLLVSDVCVPGIEGGDLAAILKPLRPHMRVLLMSGYGDAGVPGTPFLAKPFTPSQFAERIRELRAAPLQSTGWPERS
jgi:CheY-like chemotaxis protein